MKRLVALQHGAASRPLERYNADDPNSMTMLIAEPQNESLVGFAEAIVAALTGLDYVVIILAPSDGSSILPPIIATSPALSRCIGVAALGRGQTLKLNDFFLPETRREAIEKLVNAVTRKTSTAGEILLGAGQGPQFWLGYSLVPVEQPKLRTSCSVIIGKDITSQHRKASDDRATQRLFVNAFLAVDAATAVITQGGRVVMATEQFATFLGYPEGALDGSEASKVLDRATFSSISKALMAGEPLAGVKFSGEVSKQGGLAVSAAISLTTVEGRGTERMGVVTLRDPKFDGLSAGNQLAEQGRTNDRIFRVSLTDVRAAMGAKWPAVAARAMLHAEMVLRPRLDPGDIVSRTGEDAFLIWFSGGSVEENTERTARVSRHVRIALLTKFADELLPSVVSAGRERGAASASKTPEDLLARVDRLVAEPAPENSHEDARAYVAQAMKAPPVAALSMFGRNGQPLPSLWLELQPQAASRLSNCFELMNSGASASSYMDLLVLRGGITLCLEASRLGLPRHYYVSLHAGILANKQEREPLIAELKRLGATAGKKLTLVLCAPFDDASMTNFRSFRTAASGCLHSVGMLMDKPTDLRPEAFREAFSIFAFNSAPLLTEGQESAFHNACDAVHQTGAKVIARHPEDPLHAGKLLMAGVDSLVGIEPARR